MFFIMVGVCATTFSRNVFKALNEVDECGIMMITRRNKQKIIMMSEGEYEGMLETLDIMKNKPEYDHILQSIGDTCTEKFDSVDEMWESIDREIKEESGGKL
jgi:PHD/YefM family antitoxin component YafN of YafNO toxin-antitoxin module